MRRIDATASVPKTTSAIQIIGDSIFLSLYKYLERKPDVASQ
jgi:hypothetical protein